MNKVFIIGTSMTKFGRQPERSVKELADQALTEVLKDAGTSIGDIQSAVYANTMQGALEGQHAIGGQIVLKQAGLRGAPVVNVENACASSSSALNLAVAQVQAGHADVALALGVERMTHDKPGAMEWFKGAWDVYEWEKTVAALMELGSGTPLPDDVEEPPADRKSVFMEVYASLMRHHMNTYGVTTRQVAEAAAKDHQHSVHNPRAQYQRAFTADEIMAAPMISWPITLPMCSPHSDGAAAAVICSEDALDRFDRSRAVEVAATVIGTPVDRDPTDLDQHVARVAALKAYDIAGVGPSEMDVAEVHDATTFGEILQSENLGLVPRGEGGRSAEAGETRIGGRIPINTSGGLVSKGHPIAATGLGQIFELVEQLRGEAGARQVDGARWAIAQNGGGFSGVEDAVECITILARR